MNNIQIAHHHCRRVRHFLAALACLVSCVVSPIAYAWPDGITGRTLRDGGLGCSSCHSITVNQTLGVAISNFTTLGIGQSQSYTISITAGPNNTAIGIDAAASTGGVDVDVLTATGLNTQKLGNEITHTLAKNFTGGTGAGSYTFTFTMPGTAAAGAVYTLYATARSGNEWGHATSINVTATRINQATLTALIGGSGTPAASSVGLTGSLSISGGSGVGAVSYATLTPSVCTVSSTTVNYIAIGTCTVQATKAQDTQYNSTADNVSISIGQGTQTITFTPVSPKLTTDPPFTVSATAGGSGNPVIFSASGVCTSGGVNGSSITLTGGVGTCTVTANQAGNANYLAATPTNLNFSVVAAGEPFPPNCQLPLGWVQSSGAASTWSVATDFASPGSCSLKSAPLADGGTNLSSRIEFSGTFLAGNVTFRRKVSSEPSYDCFRFLVDGAEKAVGGSCTQLGFYVPGVAIGASGELDWATVTVPITAGAHTLTWSYDKDTSCCRAGLDAAWIDEVALPLAPPVITSSATATGEVGASFSYSIVASNSPWGYSATGLPPGLTVSSNGLISGTPTQVGTYIVMATAASGAGSVTQAITVTINKGAQTIPFAALDNKFFTTPSVAMPAITGGGSGNPVTYASSGVCTSSGLNGSVIQLSGALGTCSVTASQLGDTNYLDATPVTQSFLVFDPARENFPTNCVMPAGWVGAAGLGWAVAFDSAASGGCSLRASLDGTGNPTAIQYTGTFSAGNITFSRKVNQGSLNFFGSLIESCFRFFIDGVAQNIGGGTCGGSFGQNGNLSFGTVSVPIAAGVHTVRWESDPGVFFFPLQADAWIDNVVFPQTALTVTKAGGGTGTVSSTPGGITNCGGVCSALFSTGSLVSLMPTPAANSYLSSWSGGGCSGSGACNVSMSAAQSVTATFSLITAPGVPTGVVATPGNGSASVSFTAPAFNGGSPITGYRAICGSSLANGAGSPIVVSGLTNGVAVNCTVSASNAFASSLESAAASVTPRTVPSAPTALTATPANTSVTLAFTLSASNGGAAITAYNATCAAAGQTTRTGTAAGSPVVVSAMTNGVQYNCFVVATNAAGNSAPANITVTPASVPSAPIGSSARVFDGRAYIDFTPSASDGGSPITGYTISCTQGPISFTSTSSPITMTGLVTGSVYTCSLVATNAIGNSTPSPITIAPTVQTGLQLYTAVCTACHGAPPTVPQLNAAGTTATVLSYAIANVPTMQSEPVVSTLTTAERTALATYLRSLISTAPQVTPFNTPITIDLVSQINVATISFQNLEVVTPAANGTLSGFTGTSITFTPAAGYTGSDSFTFRGVRTTPTALVGDTRTINLTISPPPVPVVTSVLTASGTNGVPFSYQMLASNAPTAYASGALPSGLSLNTLNGRITGTPSVGGTFNVSISANNQGGPGPASTLVITLSPAAQSISFPAQTTGSRAYALGGTFDIDPVAAASSGLPVTYSSKTPSTCTVAGITVTMVAAGTCTIAANQGGNASFTVATEVTRSVTITATLPGAPVIGAGTPGNNQATIAFSPPANTGGVPITLYAVSCTPSGTGTGAVSPVVVSGLINGTIYACSVRATNSQGTGPASAPVNVTPAPTPTPPLITSANATTFTVNAPGSFAVTATGTPPVNAYSVTGALPAGVTFSAVTGVLSGTPTQAGPFALTFTAANGQLPNASQAFTLTVNKANQTISFTNPGTQAFSITPVPLSAAATSVLAVTFVSDTPGVCTISGTNAVLVSAGTCTIRAQQTGNANFNAATEVTQSFSVVQGSQTINFPAQTSPRAYVAGFSFPLTAASASSTLPVTYSSLTLAVCTINVSTVSMVRAGTCTIAANQSGNASVGPAAQVTQSIVFTGSAPGAPTLTTATPGSSRITLAFTAPASDGGSNISTYTGTCGALTATGSASPIVVTGLTNGTPYTCSVTATNATGTGVASNTLSATPAASAGAAVWAASCGLGGCHGSPPNATSDPAGTRLNVGGNSTAVLDYVIPRQAAMNLLVGSLSAADRLAVANYIADFIPTVSATTAFNTPVVVNVGSQVFMNTAIAAFTGLQVVSPPANGSLSTFSGTSVTYTPNLGFVGTDTFTYRATQAGLNSDIRTVTVTVQPAAPTITSALSVSGTIGVPFSYQIAATNAPTSYAAAVLPANLTVNTSSGLISGTPAAGGTSTVTISATSGSLTGSATLTINIGLIPQVITFGAQASPVVFAQGGTFSISPAASGGASGSPIVYSSATPTVCSVGGSTVTMLGAGICTIAANQAGSATYAAAATVTRSVSITGIAPASPTIGTATAGNTQASINFTPPSNTGGLPITSYTVSCNSGTVTASGGGSPIVVAGLTNGVAYTCSVQASNLAGSSPPSATVVVTPVSIVFNNTVYSRKYHGAIATPFDLPVNPATLITGAIDVEPRTIGSGHRIVFVFNSPVTSVTSVVARDAALAVVGVASASFAGNELIVTLTGVPDNQRVTVSATGVNGALNVSASIGFMVGDVNKSLTVNASDISAVRARAGQTPLNTGNYRYDLNADGVINGADISAVKARAGMKLP